MTGTDEIIDAIVSQDMVFGDIARESAECACEGKYMAALSCLFILAEQSVKYALEVNTGSFADAIENAKRSKVISKNEAVFLNQLREIRNKIFHENNYAWSYIENGVVHMFSENETKGEIYRKYSKRCFKITLKLCERNILKSH